ncbi:MAG: hypothetical protein II951_05090 [Bacteroidales bacterium]|nr:hypothetical protein [Bacteroidales bacterium]
MNKLIAIALGAVMALSFTGCGDDDEEGSYSVAMPEAVDLGLSVKWASFNLGATEPIGNGDYFAWGVTEPNGEYNTSSWSSSKYDALYNIQSYKWWGGKRVQVGLPSCDDCYEYNVTKYCTVEEQWGGNGVMDNKTVLDREDDAASVHLGGSWRIPTAEEWKELIDNCRLEDYGDRDIKLVSKKKGFEDKWIVLPLNCYKNQGYWSSTLKEGDVSRAIGVHASREERTRVYISEYGYDRYNGECIRPVCK